MAECTKCKKCGEWTSLEKSRCEHCGAFLGVRKCPSCGKINDIERSFCPSCGYLFKHTPIKADADRDDTAGKTIYLAAVVFFLIIFVGACWLLFGGSPTKSLQTSLPPVETVSSPQPGVPYEFAKDFVRDRLLAPSTAKFMPISEVNYDYYPGQKTWRFTSFVESQNAFGVMVRTKWSVKLIETKDTWKLLDIKFEQ